MGQRFEDALNDVWLYIPNIIGALLILIVGWIVAKLIASLTRKGLRRTSLDDRLARAIAGSGSKAQIRSEEWISKAVFWIIMLLVLVAFFQVLSLTIITEPLNDLIGTVLGFLPNLFAALLLLAIAWVLATVLRMLVSRGLKAMNFDERVGSEVEAQRTTDPRSTTPLNSPTTTTTSTTTSDRSFSEMLANAVYWLVFLFFLPAILDALEMDGLLGSVRALLDEVLGFLPNLFAAALILLVGWFVARIVQRIVTNVAASIGADRLGDRVGLNSVMGRQNLSGLLGLVVYILILIPVILAALDALELDAITAPASRMLDTFLAAIPNIFAAALILVIAYVVGKIVTNLVVNLLKGLGFNRMMSRVNLGTVTTPSADPTKPSTTTNTPADIVGYMVLVAIMLFAAIAAFNILGLEVLAALLTQFTVLLGQIIVGLIIFGVGLFLADLAARAIKSSSWPQKGLLALAARVSIIVLAGAMALRQMGLANEIVNLAFGLVLGALAVAFALAFGLGGREPAGREVERWFKALHSRNFDDEPGIDSGPNKTPKLPAPDDIV